MKKEVFKVYRKKRNSNSSFINLEFCGKFHEEEQSFKYMSICEELFDDYEYLAIVVGE